MLVASMSLDEDLGRGGVLLIASYPNHQIMVFALLNLVDIFLRARREMKSLLQTEPLREVLSPMTQHSPLSHRV